MRDLGRRAYVLPHAESGTFRGEGDVHGGGSIRLLVQSGFEPINIPYARQEEFNVALDELFRSDDGTRLTSFLTTCTTVDRQ